MSPTSVYATLIGTLFVALIATQPAYSATAASEGAPMRVGACTAGKARLPARCGSLSVFEDRTSQRGRTIELHFIEILAEHPSNRAIAWNPGGPGGDDLSAVPLIADGAFEKDLLALRDRYNLLFVDNRGTGRSHRIDCDTTPKQHPEYYYKQIFPDGPLRECRRLRSRDTNLAMYTTDSTVDDLDDLREALHVPKLVLQGGSYGTMFYLDYARRHPTHVESLVLQGVAPPGFFFIPLPFAKGAQSAIDGLFEACALDSACHRHFPKLTEHFAALVRRIGRGPVAVRPIGLARTVFLTKEVFADSFRHALYAHESAAYLPYVIEQAYLGHYGPLTQLVQVTSTSFGLALGLNLSVTCAEDLPFITEESIARFSAFTFQSDTRVRAQQRACRIWNVPRVDPSFSQPVRSSAPILMISGTEDPATPASYARRALRYLPNARQILIPHGTHDDESSCIDALEVTFVRRHHVARAAQFSCAATESRPPFATSMRGFGT